MTIDKEDKEKKGKQDLWYVRSGGEISGPYPSGSVRRFLLLGRVVLKDEVSKDQKAWQPVSAVPEVIPPELRRAMLEGKEDELLSARMREDERTGRERRSAEDDIKYERRRKGERRADEEATKKRRREARRSLLEATRKREMPLPSLVGSVLLLVLLIGYGLFWDSGPELPEPDCTAKPGPTANWRNCSLNGIQAKETDLSLVNMNNASLRGANLSGSNLKGSDLRYADFSSANLSYSQLSNADMKGSNLQNADLSYADLSGADLSFANLQDANPGGADLTGARFDEVIWFDGSRCLPGSVGGCARPPENNPSAP